MSEARDEVLRRIRAAKPAARYSADLEWEGLSRNYKVAPDLSDSDCRNLFIERVRDYEAHVVRCDQQDIQDVMGSLLTEKAKKRMVIPPGLPSEWLPVAFEFCVDSYLEVQQIDQFGGVLTGATLGIADTGTIVLQNTLGQGRRVITLVSDYHVCVLFERQIVQTVAQAVRFLQASISLPTTFISGPSATADIEMTRIRGVHGPRFLDVILVRD